MTADSDTLEREVLRPPNKFKRLPKTLTRLLRQKLNLPRLRRSMRVAALMWDDEAHAYRVLMGLHAQGTFKAGTWGFPGGRPNRKESFMRAAVREVREETGCFILLKNPKSPFILSLWRRQVDVLFFLAFIRPKKSPVVDWTVKDPKPLPGKEVEMTNLRLLLPEEVESAPYWDSMMMGDKMVWLAFIKPQMVFLTLGHTAAKIYM